MRSETVDRLEIHDLLENWVIWTDSGDWERFRTVWHDDGRMMATWWQGTGEEFVAVRRDAWERDIKILHTMGASSIDLAGERAIAQSRMTISQRGLIHDVLCDIVCMGRFYDFLEKRDDRWGFVLRQPIYEIDRADPVDPSQSLVLDAGRLARFPEGYRHLAYFQAGIGYQVKPDMPGWKGPEAEALYARGARWLKGGAPIDTP